MVESTLFEMIFDGGYRVKFSLAYETDTFVIVAFEISTREEVLSRGTTFANVVAFGSFKVVLQHISALEFHLAPPAAWEWMISLAAHVVPFRSFILKEAIARFAFPRAVVNKVSRHVGL